MTTATVLMLATLATPAAQTSLVIKAVSPRTDPAGSAMCSVLLQNTHARAAVAWVLQTIPTGEMGSANDLALAPGLWVQPNDTRSVTFPCERGETPAVWVAAALFDDRTIEGDARLLNTAVLRSRAKRAAGLRELARLLSGAGEPRMSTAPVLQLRRLIESSAGPAINTLVQAEALRALSRAERRTGPSGTFDFLRQALLAEIGTSIRALEAVQIAEVRK